MARAPSVILLLGDAKTGKSTFAHTLVQFASGAREASSQGMDYTAAGIIFDEQGFEYQGGRFVLRNTSGKETLDTIRTACYKDAVVILLCFASNNAKSLDNIKTKWHPEAKRLAPHARFLLVCLQSDLMSKKKRRMSVMKAPMPELEGKAWSMARSLGCTAVVSVSAKTGERVEEVLRGAAKLGSDTASQLKAAAETEAKSPSFTSMFDWMAGLWGPSKESLSKELHKASSMGDLEVAKSLLNKGAHASWKPSVTADPLRQSPLHVAVTGKHYDVCLALINAGADLEAQDSHGNTPLHLACRGGMLDIAKLLLSRGAAVNGRNMLQNTPLHEACGPDGKNKALVDMLVTEFRANTKCRNLKGQLPIETARANGLAYLFVDEESNE